MHNLQSLMFSASTLHAQNWTLTGAILTNSKDNTELKHYRHLEKHRQVILLIMKIFTKKDTSSFLIIKKSTKKTAM